MALIRVSPRHLVATELNGLLLTLKHANRNVAWQKCTTCPSRMSASIEFFNKANCLSAKPVATTQTVFSRKMPDFSPMFLWGLKFRV